MLTRHEHITLAADLSKALEHLSAALRRLDEAGADAIATQLVSEAIVWLARASRPLTRSLEQIAEERT